MKRFGLIAFRAIVTFFCLTWLGKNLLLPVTVGILYYDDYMRLTTECGQAMDSSWYIQQTTNPALKTSEKVQLLACHEYDKVRKIMLVSGISEDMLAYLGLHALEVYQRPAEEFVEQHRFQER